MAAHRSRRIIVGLSLAIALLLVEASLRYWLGNAEISRFDIEPGDGRCVALTPGVGVTYTGWAFRVPAVLHETNAAGFRGPARPHAKAERTLRVIALGDSTTYGQGCAAEDAFPSHLERMLSSESAPVEVLNFGVPGYNFEEYGDQYEHFASRWAHDVVLTTLSPNDLDPPLCSMLQHQRTLWLIKNVYVARAIFAFATSATFFGEQPATEDGAERLRSLLVRLRDVARRQGARVVVVDRSRAWPEDVPDLSAAGVAASLELPYFDLDSCSVTRDDPGGEFPTIAGEGHWDAEGNRLVATCLATFLRQDVLRSSSTSAAAQ